MRLVLGHPAARGQRSTGNAIRGWLGISFLILFVGGCNLSMLNNTYLVLFAKAPFTGLVWLVLGSILSCLMWVSYAACALRDAGVTPAWVRADYVEAFVERVVQEVAVMDRAEDDAPTHLYTVEGPTADECHRDDIDCRMANDAAVAAVQERLTTEASNSTPLHIEEAANSEADSFNDEEKPHRLAATGAATTVVPIDDAAAMIERRNRKRRRGLSTVTVAQVAREALRALQGDGPSRTRELTFLLHDAQYCRYCMVYKLEGTHHCRVCARCVHHLDHHCVWVGQCVGVGNHKYYVLFLLYLALLGFISSVLSLYVVYRGYNFFFQEPEVHFGFFFAFSFTFSFSMVLIPYVLRHLYEVGCGETTVSAISREQREMAELTQRREAEDGRLYQPLFAEEAAPPLSTFNFANLHLIFGDGPLWSWFVPTMAPLQDAYIGPAHEEHFWAELRIAVVKQIRSIADGTHQAEDVAVGMLNSDVGDASVARDHMENEGDGGIVRAVLLGDDHGDSVNGPFKPTI